jgi:hypothetical protein
MTSSMLLALAATSVGFLTAVVAIVHTTPLTMLAFFMLGLGGFGVGFALYVYAVFRDLRAKRVL